MFKVIDDYERLSDVQKAMLEVRVLQADPFYDSLKRLLEKTH